MRIRTVIIDDERPICDEIEYLLKRELDIDIVAKFTNAVDALAFFANSACDLIIVDIKMPGMSGLDMAQKLTALRRPPLIVFATAFPEHALEAFDTLAVGFITKPITETNLSKVIDKVRTITALATQRELRGVNRVSVMKNGSYIPLDKQEIHYAYVRNKEVYIRTKDTEYCSTLTIQEIERLLPEPVFMRVHRQYVVNLSKVSEIVPWSRGTYKLRLEAVSGETIPVSRTKVRELRTLMGMP